MKKTMLAIAVLVAAVAASFAQPKRIPNANFIPDSLKQGACAVVRTDSTITECTSPLMMTSRHVFTITVLNKDGAEYGHFVEHTKKGSSLKGFSGTLYDANGAKKRTFWKNDLTSTGLSTNTADDYTTHYLEISSPSYPYTITWEWEVSHSDGYISIPPFAPAYYTGVSVERASYTLITHNNRQYSSKAVNTDIRPEVHIEKNTRTEVWRMSGLRPYREDAFMPPSKSVLPHIYFTPHEFHYLGTRGNASTWEEYGKWQWSLMEGRGILPPELKQAVHSITDTIPLRREKIKALYNYLGRTTRYVSIQLGLGSLQPMSAEEVYKNGFGDCKGLSNYLKAMLKECGIESHYAEINTKYPRILKDNTSVLQTNHVVLKVPDPAGDLWLECTNPQIPFGYIHEDIAGHDAVVYSNGTAHIETVPSYPDTLNRIVSNVTVKMDNNGECLIRIKETYANRCAEQLLGLSSEDLNTQKELLKGQLKIPSCTVDSVFITEHHTQRPSVELEYVCRSTSWIRHSSGRIFIPASIFKGQQDRFNRKRELDIEISSGHVWESSLTIELPGTYIMESGIADVDTTSCMGYYRCSSSISGNRVEIISSRKYMRGKYPKEMAGQIKGFISIATGLAEKKIILRKQ